MSLNAKFDCPSHARYVAKITALADSLNDEESKPEAIELLRALVSQVRLHPDENAPDGHFIELFLLSYLENWLRF